MKANNKLPKVSIVILDFQKSKRICENVASIQLQRVNFDYEIIIVDNSCNPENAKTLNTLRDVPNLRIFINDANVGYIRGNNKGTDLARGEYLFIVNPDMIWADPLAMQKLVDFMDKHPEVGICGPKQINDTDGQVAMSVRAFPKLFLQVSRRTFLRNLPLIRKWVAYDEMRHLDYDKTQPVDWLQSSFWVISKKLFYELGAFDKSYLSFMSDPELCFQCWESGKEVVYYTGTYVYADGRRCSEGGIVAFFQKRILRQHTKDAIIYEFKHFFRRRPSGR